jgi:hypothetical protein
MYPIMISTLLRPLAAPFWALPHDARRAVWRTFRPVKFRDAEIRRREPDRKDSIYPFDRYRCIFAHVPKTAGMSLSDSLFGHPVGFHTTLRRWSFIFSEKDFREYFKFSIVRNPWDRLYSAFAYLKAGGGSTDDRQWAAANLAGIDDFQVFVTKWLPRIDIERSYIHFIPQYRFLRLNGMAPAVDFIGHFETIAEDFETIRSRLGVDATLSHLNPSSRSRDYREIYTNEMKEIVACAYRDDIALFGYEFDRARASSLAEPSARMNGQPRQFAAQPFAIPPRTVRQ